LVYGVIGTPARASIYNKKELLDLAKEVFDSVMIVSEPFVVAYGINKLEDAMIIDIGAGTVDLCRMQGALPDETNQITLTTAGEYVDEIFYKLSKKKYPQMQTTLDMMRLIKEKYSFVHDINDVCEVTLPIAGKPTRLDLTEELKEACRSIVPSIVEAVQRLIADCDPEYQERIRNNIILAGGGSQLRGLDRLIEDAMVEYGGAKVTKVYEPVFAGANGALKLAMEMPEEYWQEITEVKEELEEVEEKAKSKK
jgi:rod shape-determining protein MreB